MKKNLNEEFRFYPQVVKIPGTIYSQTIKS